MQALGFLNSLIAILFTVCYFYQFVYIPVPWLFGKRKKKKSGAGKAPVHDFAVLICARNEAAVIGDLVDSLCAQDYPQDRLHVFVMADNCSDNTAEIAAAHGARVYTRHNLKLVGKGYALDALLGNLRRDCPSGFDGYFVFDADNLLRRDYVSRMNDKFSEGSDIITSYRNSKNFGDNWISAGYALWFLRESRYLNEAREIIGTSCAVAGTGFFFSRKILEETGGWTFHTMTEDTEFSIDQITKGRRIAYCGDAVFYDEQPVKFAQSWRQRMRWARGYIQVLGKYGGRLLKGMLHGSFSCFDMTMTIMPAFVLSALSILCNAALGIWGAIAGEDMGAAVRSLLGLAGSTYFLLFLIGAVTTVTEWRNIIAKPAKKILYAFTFPFFMLTYIPISIAALFRDTGWKPVLHTRSAVSLPADFSERTGCGRR